MLQGNLKYDQIFIKKNKYDIIRFFLFNNNNNVGGEIGRKKKKCQGAMRFFCNR